MLVIELIKNVSFEAVQKELFLTGRYSDDVLLKFEGYFHAIKENQLSFEANQNKIQVNRENFETSFYIEPVEKEVVAQLTTFVSADKILCSNLLATDLNDLSKELIVSTILNLLTFNGTCFSEEEREKYVCDLKEHVDAISNAGVVNQ